MKNKLFSHSLAFVCVMVLMMASCEKMVVDDGSSGEENVDNSNVIIRIISFQELPFDLSRTRASVEDVCQKLNFFVYDQSGERLQQIVQQVGDEGFGQASFSLGEGHYYLVVLAHSSSGNPTSTNAQKIGFTNTTGFSDTFYYADSIIVEDSPVEQQINLNRIVAKVRFESTEVAPAAASGVAFYYTGGSGTLNAADGGWGSVNSKQLVELPKASSGGVYEVYTIPRKDSDYLWMRVNAYNGNDLASGNILSSKIIENIPIKRNHVTICKGRLFSPDYDMDVTITVNSDWAGTINYQF